MKVKLQRLVRTPTSEEIVLQDLDSADKDGAPRTMGKLDVHYTEDGIYGTLLLWPASIEAMNAAAVRSLVEGTIIEELVRPVGVPDTYNIELYCPDLDRYELYSNLPEE